MSVLLIQTAPTAPFFFASTAGSDLEILELAARGDRRLQPLGLEAAAEEGLVDLVAAGEGEVLGSGARPNTSEPSSLELAQLHFGPYCDHVVGHNRRVAWTPSALLKPRRT